jgi:hypothetical protein
VLSYCLQNIVTSIEDAMKRILEGIHESMAVDVDEPKSLTLKQRDFKQAIDVIDKNFYNSLVKLKPEKKATPTAKTNYRILLCGGAPGIGNFHTFSCIFLQQIMRFNLL